jgi:hypothetical protein
MTPSKLICSTTNHISVSHLRSIKFMLWLGSHDVRLSPPNPSQHLLTYSSSTASNSSSAKKSAPSTTSAATPSPTCCFPASADAAPSFKMRRRSLHDRLVLVDTQSQRAWSLDRRIRLRGKIYPDGWRGFDFWMWCAKEIPIPRLRCLV